MIIARAILGAWLGSKPLQWALVALLSLGGYEGWKYHQQHVGASKLEAKIEQKADADAHRAEIVREAVDAALRQPPPPDKPNRMCGKFERCAGH